MASPQLTNQTAQIIALNQQHSYHQPATSAPQVIQVPHQNAPAHIHHHGANSHATGGQQFIVLPAGVQQANQQPHLTLPPGVQPQQLRPQQTPIALPVTSAGIQHSYESKLEPTVQLVQLPPTHIINMTPPEISSPKGAFSMATPNAITGPMVAPSLIAGTTPRVEVGRWTPQTTFTHPAKGHLTIHGDVAFADGDDTNLIVNYVPAEFTDADLEALFAHVGPIRGARVIKDSQGGAKGYGFVRFADLDGSLRALDVMSCYPIRNKRLKVNIARPTGRVVMRQGRVVDLGAVPPHSDQSPGTAAESLDMLRSQQEQQHLMALAVRGFGRVPGVNDQQPAVASSHTSTGSLPSLDSLLPVPPMAPSAPFVEAE